MTTEIGEIIFGTNSTLYEVLDTLQVPELNSRVDSVQENLNATQSQLVQLGIIVDNNQSSANERFALVNTRVDTLDTRVDVVEDQYETLNNVVNTQGLTIADIINALATQQTALQTLDNTVISLSNSVSNQQTQISNQQTQITSLSNSVTNQQTQLNSLETGVSGLTNQFIQLTLQVQSLQAQVATINGYFASIPVSLRTVFERTATVAFGVTYHVRNVTTTGGTNIKFNSTGVGDRPIMGTLNQSGEVGGNPYNYVSANLTNTGVAWTTGAPIPVGTVLRLRYGVNSSNYTSLNNVVLISFN